MKTEQPIQPPVPATEVIPPMTDPMGKHWDQPALAGITINPTHAFMDKTTFDALADYSCSVPTGVYPGKMWKMSDSYDRTKPAGQLTRWWLRWFGVTEDPAMCSNNIRQIVISP